MILGDIMTKLIEIPKDETIKVSSNVISYVKPNAVYIPYEEKPLININTPIQIGSALFQKELK